MRLLILLGLLLLTGCGLCVNGSGNVVTKDDFIVSYFDSVDLKGTGDIYITQGGENSLRVEAEDNIIANMRFNVLGKVLTVEEKTCLKNTKPIKIYVTMNDVKSVSISGSGNIFSKSEVNSPDLTLDVSGSGGIDMVLRVQKLNTLVSGSGNVRLSGIADRHTYSLSGSGSLDAPDLKTAYTTIGISGSGNSFVNVDQELDVKVTGSGDVVYRGQAQVTSDVSGSGKVTKE